jgi:heat-inducible transcriptional repressor
VVLVFADGQVENRVFTPPLGQTPSSMREAANFLNALAEGRTLSELRSHMASEIALRRQELDGLAADLVESGLAQWEDKGEPYERLIVRGRANLIGGEVDLERIRSLFDGPDRRRRRCAHFYRFREQAFLTFGFLSGRLSLYER